MTSPADVLTSDGGTGPEDLILVRAALRGEAAAVDGVLARLSCIPRFVFRLNRSLGYGLDTDQLQDVVQQVYMAVWPRLTGYVGSAALESWVFGFCRNCLRAEARRRAQSQKMMATVLDEAEHSPPAVDEPAAAALSRVERWEAAMDELERLEVREREVVRLRHLEGWSFEQIARQQGLPPSTVKDRCYRALVKLKGRLKRRDVSA